MQRGHGPKEIYTRYCSKCKQRYKTPYPKSDKCPGCCIKPGAKRENISFKNDGKNSKLIRINGVRKPIDARIANLVSFINNETNYETILSCSGHGKYPPSIIMRSKKDAEAPVFELFSGVIFKNTKNRLKYYKRDAPNGAFYLPEVMETGPETKYNDF